MSSKSITEWQQPLTTGTTTIIQSTSNFNCGHCQKHQKKGKQSKIDLIMCQTGSVVDFFCSSCWDTQEFCCPDCQTIPSDKDIVGCDSCGQWSHNYCQIEIEDVNNYICSCCITKNERAIPETVDQSTIDVNKEVESLIVSNQRAIAKSEASEKLCEALLQKHISSQQELETLKKEKSSYILATNRTLQKQNDQFRILTEKNKLYAKNNDTLKTELKKVVNDLQIRKQATSVLGAQVIALNKRTREHDGMVELMSRYVKRHKPNCWLYSVPDGLSVVDAMLWKQYECKYREQGSSQTYSADKITSKVGNVPLWDNLSDLLETVHDLYARKK